MAVQCLLAYKLTHHSGWSARPIIDGPPKLREHQLANFARGSNPAYRESKIPQPKTQHRTTRSQTRTETTQNGTRNINVTTQSRATKEKRREPDQCDTRKLKVEKETVINNRSNNATTAPLMMEITVSPGRYKPFKMNERTRVLTFSMTEAAPGRTSRKRKSF